MPAGRIKGIKKDMGIKMSDSHVFFIIVILNPAERHP